MQAKEFLALADQLAAFQAITSGSLKQEADAARTALQALQDAQDLTKLQDSLAKDKVAYDAYKAATEAAFDQNEADLKAQAASLASAQSDLAAKEAQLATDQEALVAAQQKLIADQQAAQQAAVQGQAVIAAGQAQLESDKAALAALQTAVATANDEVNRKLAILKGL